jgi:hypothetical protein
MVERVLQQVGGLDPVEGGEVVLPGSEQVAPLFWGFVTAVALVAVVVAWVVRRRRARRGVPQRRPFVLGGFGALAVVAAVLVALTFPPGFSTPEFPELGRILPEEAFFHRSVEDLPVSQQSDSWVGALAEEPLVAAFGDEPSSGIVWGVPFNPVDRRSPRKEVDILLWKRNSFMGEYPIADPAYIESMPTYGFDNHYVAIDLEERRMWELQGTRVWFGRWQADSGAVWDLDELRFPDNSTTASRLPLLPGVLSWHEVAAGEVTHVLHAGTPISSPEDFTWPARATDGRSDDPAAPPMGAWLRLRKDADLSQLGPQARVIAEGLQRYGMVLSDTAGNFGIRGTPDARWERSDLRTLRTLSGADFEVVDPSGIVVDPASMEVRPPGP